MKKSRTLMFIALIALLVSISLAAATSNDVPVTALEDTVIPIDYGQFAPPECAGMTFVNIIRGSGNLVEGSDSNDLIFCVSCNNKVYGYGGNDCIVGGDGNEHIFGGDGNDVLLGGAGNDHLEGGIGNDILWGGPGNDHLYGDDKDDGDNGDVWYNKCWGGDGNDNFDENCDEIHDP